MPPAIRHVQLRRVALLIEASRAMRGRLVRGVAVYQQEHQDWSISYTPQRLDDPPPDWLRVGRATAFWRLNDRRMADAVARKGAGDRSAAEAARPALPVAGTRRRGRRAAGFRASCRAGVSAIRLCRPGARRAPGDGRPRRLLCAPGVVVGPALRGLPFRAAAARQPADSAPADHPLAGGAAQAARRDGLQRRFGPVHPPGLPAGGHPRSRRSRGDRRRNDDCLCDPSAAVAVERRPRPAADRL